MFLQLSKDTVVLKYDKLYLYKLCFQLLCTHLGQAHIDYGHCASHTFSQSLINMASNVVD